MRDRITCCKDCEDRHSACWSDCQMYKDEKAELEVTKSVHKSKQEAMKYSADRIEERINTKAKLNKKNQGYNKKYHHN